MLSLGPQPRLDFTKFDLELTWPGPALGDSGSDSGPQAVEREIEGVIR